MKQPAKAVEWILLALILLLAATLRLTRLDLIEFKFDEATTARSALRIAREGHLPALGMVSSQGPHNPPLTSYFLAPAFGFSRDPRLAAGWVAFLGVVAVGLTYWLGRRYFGWPVGALAALLFAASPWAAFYSRKVWAENLPALTLVFIIALLAAIVRRKPWALAGAFAAAAGLASLHLAGIAFFFILAVVMALFPRRLRLLPVLVGVALVVAILSPYLLHDARHDWQNLRAFAGLADQEASVDLQPLGMASMAIGGYHLQDLAGERYNDFLGRMIVDLRWLDVVEMALFWLGLFWLVWRVVRARLGPGPLPPEESARVVLLCWFAVPVVLLLRRSAPLNLHTFTLLYPVQHLVIALVLADAVVWAAGRLGGRVGRGLAIGVAILTALIVGWQVYVQQSLLSFVDSNDTPGGYGAPVKYALAASRSLEAIRHETGAGELVLLLAGADPRYDGEAAVFDVLLDPGRRLTDGRSALVLPASGAAYLVTPGAEAAGLLLEASAVAMAPALHTLTGSGEAYRFFCWGPGEVLPPHVIEGEDVRWASSATLLRYDWEGEARAGGSVRWTLVFRVEAQPPPGVDLHWFNHLVDTNGNRWGQTDGVGYPASEWRVGDTVMIWFDIAISPDAPPPPYYVRSGMYTYPEIANVPLLDPAGNPAGQFVELGPVGVPP